MGAKRKKMTRAERSKALLPSPTQPCSVIPADLVDSSVLGRLCQLQGRDYSLAILKIIAKAAKVPAKPCPLMMGAV